MEQILIDNPILLLFIVASLGYLLGEIKIKGVSIGVAAVLFTGLAFGALNPAFSIPSVIFQLGLVIFIYSIGLNSGPTFFALASRASARRTHLSLSADAVFTCCGRRTAAVPAGYAPPFRRHTSPGAGESHQPKSHLGRAEET